MEDAPVDALKEAIDALKEQMSNVQKMHSELDKDEKAMDIEMAELIQFRELEMEHAQRTEERYKADMNRIESVNNELIQILNDQTTKLNKVQKKNEELLSQRDAGRGQMDALCAEMKAAKHEISIVHSLQEQLVRELKKVKLEKTKQSKDADKEQRESNAQISELKLQRDGLQKTVNGLNQKGLEFKEKLETLKNAQSERDAVCHELDALKQTFKNQKNRKSHLLAAMERMTEELKHSEAEKDRLADATKKELAEVAVLKMRCDQFEHTLRQKKAKRHGAHRGLKHLKCSLIGKGDESVVIKADVTLIRSKSSSKQQLESLEHKMASQQHQIAVLNQQKKQIENSQSQSRSE